MWLWLGEFSIAHNRSTRSRWPKTFKPCCYGSAPITCSKRNRTASPWTPWPASTWPTVRPWNGSIGPLIRPAPVSRGRPASWSTTSTGSKTSRKTTTAISASAQSLPPPPFESWLTSVERGDYRASLLRPTGQLRRTERHRPLSAAILLRHPPVCSNTPVATLEDFSRQRGDDRRGCSSLSTIHARFLRVRPESMRQHHVYNW